MGSRDFVMIDTQNVRILWDYKLSHFWSSICIIAVKSKESSPISSAVPLAFSEGFFLLPSISKVLPVPSSVSCQGFWRTLHYSAWWSPASGCGQGPSACFLLPNAFWLLCPAAGHFRENWKHRTFSRKISDHQIFFPLQSVFRQPSDFHSTFPCP